VSAYGYPDATTPSLDALASEGALFERAVSTSNWTLPAHMSALTGLSPSAHRVEDEEDRLPDEVVTLAQSFRQAGYATAGFASHIYLDERYGFARGFDRYAVAANQRAARVSERAISWLADLGSGPFFLFLHYFDPHWSFDPPEEFRERFGSPPRQAGRLLNLYRYQEPGVEMPPELVREVSALYDGEIAYTDREIGRVLAWLRDRGRLDHTVVAVVSDHGEEFGDHGGFGHATHLHGEVSGIPMLVRFPAGVPAGTRRRELVSLVDLPVTLLALAGIDPAPQFTREGLPLFSSVSDGAERSLVAESTRTGPKRFAVRAGDYKLLSGGRYRPVSFARRNGKLAAFELDPVEFEAALYDVAEDPRERRNLLAEEGWDEEARRLRETLDGFLERTARGVRLSCTARAGPEVAGTVTFRAPLLDEPFPLTAEGTASVEELEPTRFAILLRPGAGEAALLFPTTADKGSIGIELAAADGTPFGGTFAIPAAGSATEIGPGGKARGPCRIAVPEGLAAGREGRVELTPEDRERLRELGYAE